MGFSSPDSKLIRHKTAPHRFAVSDNLNFMLSCALYFSCPQHTGPLRADSRFSSHSLALQRLYCLGPRSPTPLTRGQTRLRTYSAWGRGRRMNHIPFQAKLIAQMQEHKPSLQRQRLCSCIVVALSLMLLTQTESSCRVGIHLSRFKESLFCSS